MEKKIRIGIVGYGNLGKGVEKAILENSDMELVAIFTRRQPASVKTLSNCKLLSVDEAINYINDIDVMILCGGSAKDLPTQSLEFSKYFNTVDSYDRHSNIPGYFKNINEISTANETICVMSIGWDPGLFSLNRLIMQSILPAGKNYTFWGPGISQGHSDAIRKISGVKNAVQYTLPNESVINEIRNGSVDNYTTRQKHTRFCYVVSDDDADIEYIKKEIVNMPDYFADYDTTVKFITAEELSEKHSAMPHGGFVIQSDVTDNQIMEFSLKLASNPCFTANVLVAYARAVIRLKYEGKKGAFTIFDIPPAYISKLSSSELLKIL